jgi:hypothetical protein
MDDILPTAVGEVVAAFIFCVLVIRALSSKAFISLADP